MGATKQAERHPQRAVHWFGSGPYGEGTRTMRQHAIGHFEGYFRLFWTNYRWREHRKRMIYKASRITPILRTPDPLVRRQYFYRNILINMSAYGADRCVHALQCTTDHY